MVLTGSRRGVLAAANGFLALGAAGFYCLLSSLVCGVALLGLRVLVSAMSTT